MSNDADLISEDKQANELMVIHAELPATVQDMPDFIKKQSVALNILRVALKSGKVPVEKFDELLLAGQELGDKILDAKVELGKILLKAPSAQGKRTDLEKDPNLVSVENEVTSKIEAAEKLGLSKTQSYTYKQMAEHPNIIKKIKDGAREYKDIPTEYFFKKKLRELTKNTAPSGDVRGSSTYEKRKFFTNLNKIAIGDNDTEGKFNPNDENLPLIMPMDAISFFDWCPPYDLMMTQPEYQELDIIDNSESEFINDWVYTALDKMKPTGSAYIVIDGTPDMLRNYLNAPVPDGVRLENILIWRYYFDYEKRNNYQLTHYFILYYRGKDSGSLNDGIPSGIYNTLEIDAGKEIDKHSVSIYILQSSKEGDIVVDPFCNTKAIINRASKLGRKTYGAKYEDLDSEGAIEKSELFEWLKKGLCQLGGLKSD